MSKTPEEYAVEWLYHGELPPNPAAIRRDAQVASLGRKFATAKTDARRAALEEAAKIADGCAADARDILDRGAGGNDPAWVQHWSGEIDAANEIACEVRALLDAAPKGATTPGPLFAKCCGVEEGERHKPTCISFGGSR